MRLDVETLLATQLVNGLTMIQGLYGAATAMEAGTIAHEVVSRNLAHINVPGFRRGFVQYGTFEMAQGSGPNGTASLGTKVDGIGTDFTPGKFEDTGRPLDVAINGDGFFALQGGNDPIYTRNGSFHISADGELVTASGQTVMGAGGGPILIPPNTTPSDIKISSNGTLFAKGANLGQLQISTFPDNHRLIAVGTTTFMAPEDMAPEDADVEVAQGVRESSNVSAVEELVQLIGGFRYFEASQRAIRALAESVGQNTDPSAG